jgi:hypothetical protein
MSYVIYNAKTWKRHEGHTGSSYANERVAKGVRTKAKLAPAEWLIASYDDWRTTEPMVETHNMLDPERKPFLIRASDKGTCVDPATERYHSM